MDTYLMIALNNLLEELLAPLASTTAEVSGNPTFSSLLGASQASAGSSTPQSGNVAAALNAAAGATGLSPALLKAVATVESGLNPTAISDAGALGLMQLMPTTAATLNVNPDNAAQNALGGAEYLKSLLGEFHQNLSLALAAYNAGPGAVDQFGGIPPYQQTEQYVRSVLAQYQANMGPTTPAS